MHFYLEKWLPTLILLCRVMIHKLNVPIELIRYSVTSGARKPLALLLAIKFHSGGKLRASDDAWSAIKAPVGIKDVRTLRKHLTQLQALKWLGYNPKSDYYFVRSFDRIRLDMGLKKRTSVIMDSSELPRVQSWCDGVLINCVIRDQMYHWEVGPRKFKRFVLSKKDGTSPIQRVDPGTQPAYYGLSSFKISKHLNCSQSQACKRKRLASQNGYLTLKKHFKVLHTLSEPDMFVREQFVASHPELTGRLRFRVVYQNGTSIIQLVQQLHDEIIPQTLFSKRKKITKLLRSSCFSF
jgi:hypothetical protein